MWLALLPLALADDAAIVADALRRQGARLEAEGCAEAGKTVERAAVRLDFGLTGDTAEQALGLSQVTDRVERAASEEFECVNGFTPLPQTATSMALPIPYSLTDVGDQLARWGEPEAADAWARLIAPALPPLTRTGAPPDGCRCMSELRPALPLVYGYPSTTLLLLSDLNVVALGGCMVSDHDPILACSTGCYEDARRPEDPPAEPRPVWRIIEDRDTVLVMIGSPSAFETAGRSLPKRRDLAPLQACVAEKSPAIAIADEEGAFMPRDDVDSAQHAADACLADWADANLADAGLSRVGVHAQWKGR
ncbi:MAG: hypothetical protein H6739_01405 [Alphaproteobacteria bacterium]|nr:hypothetical protein [Alphaproteobacteria bacterium]